MRKVFRLTRQKYAYDLSGTGSALYGARWNPKGTYLLYTASSASLALLEWMAHAHDLDVDEVYCLVTLLVPDECIWKIHYSDLPENWRQSPPPESLKSFGQKLVQSAEWYAMEVPSVLMPKDWNLVIHALHPLAKKIEIEQVEILEMDQRLFRSI